MKQYKPGFLSSTSLACAALLFLGTLTRAQERESQHGGVLFYAGFDGSKNADYAAGSPQAHFHEGGGTLNADGLGFRGSALRTGDGEGYLEYPAAGNIDARAGTIEFWMYAQNWDHDDGHFHRLIDVRGEGQIFFYLRPPGAGEFVVRSTSKTASRAYGSSSLKGKWSWYAMTWEKDARLGFYIGGIKGSGEAWTHDCSAPSGATPVAENLQRILIGDFGGQPSRRAHTLIDEVYIYDRALTREEVDWVVRNALTRKRGKDIPENFMQPRAKVVPDPSNHTLVVEIDSGDRSGNFAGLARLEPAMGTVPATITQTNGRFGQAVISYADLPTRAYRVICDITNKDNEPVASIVTRFVAPGPPVWLQQKVGVSDVPPPPWTPVQGEDDRVRMWGRDYQLGTFGLPVEIQTQDASVLAGPVHFRSVVNGADITWTPGKRQITKRTKAEVVYEGTAGSNLGELSWRTQAEFDGFLLHDLVLAPAQDATVDLMELRIPIRKEFALLYSQGSRTRGFLPLGQGKILGAGGYWWIGNDDLGLCGVTEHDGSMVAGGDGHFSIAREPNGDVTVVYRFASKPTSLAEPWSLRLVLQATPTKPLPPNWRTWRDAAPFAGPQADYLAWQTDVKLWIAYPWPHEKAHKHFAFPVVKDAVWYRDHVKNLHAGGPGMWRDSETLRKESTPGVRTSPSGNKVLPYSMFAFMAPGMPECDFYWREWYNPLGFSSLGEGLYKYAAVRPVPSYIDFMVWKHRELIREYGHDGLYIDFAGLCQAALDVEHGLGYKRDGVEHPATFPIVATREIWKRMYTMLRQENPGALLVGHTSENSCAPILSFLDIWEPGEGNWFGQLKDNYLEVLPLDELRAEFRAQHFGGISWWLPAWQRAAVLEDKDVAVRRADGSVGTVSVEKTHHMLGIGLLLDIFIWPITGTNYAAVRPLYAVQDEFGMGDVEFLGYWDNASVIGGQTAEIRASAYRKPQGGALLVVYNTTRKTRVTRLGVDWERLKSNGPLEVLDAYTKEPVEVDGSALELEVPPLNYRLLWVR